MTRLSSTRAREEFSDTLTRGKDLAARVSVDDLKLLRELEDRLDLVAAKRAMKEKGKVSWRRLKALSGL